jgi:hypothetical protein
MRAGGFSDAQGRHTGGISVGDREPIGAVAAHDGTQVRHHHHRATGSFILARNRDCYRYEGFPMSLGINDTPTAVLALMVALQRDQMQHPHISPTDRPVSELMANAQCFDVSTRMPFDYEFLTYIIDCWARKHMRPYATCDECGHLMCKDVPTAEQHELEYAHVFSASREKITSYMLCEWCHEQWLSEGDNGLPRITGLKHFRDHDERWIRAGKDKLRPLPPSGGLYAGVVIPGGSGPIKAPFRSEENAGVLMRVGLTLDSLGQMRSNAA